jgi:ATP-dependent Clp protease, protease subunit
MAFSAKGFLAELGALPERTPIDLRLNSPGGSVFDAVAIYNALKRHEGPVTVTIDGIAASAASYIAMAGDEVVMPENAFLMIHDPSGLVMGTAGEMRNMAEALDKIAGSLIRGYAAKSGKSDEEIATLIAAETWFDAAEAVEAGFADRIAEPVRIAARFDIASFRNAPPLLVAAVQNDPDAVEDSEPDADAAEDEAETVVVDAPSSPSDAPDPAMIRAEAMAHASPDFSRRVGASGLRIWESSSATKACPNSGDGPDADRVSPESDAVCTC